MQVDQRVGEVVVERALVAGKAVEHRARRIGREEAERRGEHARERGVVRRSRAGGKGGKGEEEAEEAGGGGGEREAGVARDLCACVCVRVCAFVCV